VSSLGLKLVGTELEVGFTVSTREEFDIFVARLEMMADSVWPAQNDSVAVEPRKEDQVEWEDLGWRETQGLR